MDVEVSCPHCSETLTVHVDLDVDAAVNKGINRLLEALCNAFEPAAG